MKSEAVFWEIISQFNMTNIIIQIVLIGIGIILTLLVYLRPFKSIQIAMKFYLAIVFGWLAIAFFYILDDSNLSKFFSIPLFLILAVSFGISMGKAEIQFSFPQRRWQKIITIAFYILILSYPLISFILGHRYPTLSTPMMPCPMSIFTLTLIWGSELFKDMKNMSKNNLAILWIIIIGLTIWALMGLPKMFGLFNVREDTILFFSGIYSIVMIVRVIMSNSKK